MMGKMREDRAPVKWNKKFIYPKSQRSLIQGKRHYTSQVRRLNYRASQQSFPQLSRKRRNKDWRIGKQDSGLMQPIELGI